MSFHIKRENLDKENSHVSLPSKEQLRTKTSENAVLPQKRPLVAKAASDKRIKRVPLGGKDQNLAQNFPFASLQRSQSSIPQKLPYKPAQVPSNWQPSLGRSNSSLGFSHSKPGLNAGRPVEPSVAQTPKPVEKTSSNPLKNDLLSADEATRSNALVPRFSADSLQKPQPKALDPIPTLSFSAAPQLHASNIPPVQRTKEPVKKGTAQMDRLIETLAEDEHSIEIVPEKAKPLLDSPGGISPLSGPKFRFLQPEVMGRRSLATSFDSSVEMSLDDIVGDINERESTRIEPNAETEMAVELENAGPIGLSEQELNDLLDY